MRDIDKAFVQAKFDTYKWCMLTAKGRIKFGYKELTKVFETKPKVPTNIVIGSKLCFALWKDKILFDAVKDFYDHINGKLGEHAGYTIYTDSYIVVEFRTLQPEEFILLPTTIPIDKYLLMNEYIKDLVTNGRD